MMPDTVRLEFMAYVERMVGLPYRFGGDDPMTGFDCSGLVVEGLQAVGVLEPKTDYTADALWKMFEKQEIALPRTGALVFFGTKEKVTHVGICKNPWLMIEAGGGDHTTVDETTAARQNAFIRVRPIGNRKDRVGVVDPFLV